jgi:hypothetical protein
MQANGISGGAGLVPRTLPQKLPGTLPGTWTVSHTPLVARFLGKIVLDVLPAALASVIGGFLFTQYQFGHSTSQPAAVPVASPASAEMIQLVRDEHSMIIDYLKAQVAAQKTRLAAEDADARAVADASAPADTDAVAEPKAAVEGPARHLAAVVAPKAGTARVKPSATASAVPMPSAAPPLPPTRPPLVVAQADLTAAAPPADRLASDPNSLLAKTLDLKDHVVAATRHAVSAIGDVFSSVGERIGGIVNPDSGSAGRQFSSAS